MKPLIYRIVFLCAGLLLAATGLVQAQTPCRQFVQVSVGGIYGYCLAIANDGTLWTWGGGGGLTQVGTDQDWKQAEAGYDHNLALKTNGSLWAWGGNDRGQLGLGHTTSQTTPVQVGAATDWDRLVPGLGNQRLPFSMALKTNGSLWFFGNDRYYPSGLSEEPPYNIPHVEDRLSPVEAGTQANDWKVVSAGYVHIVAVKTDGTLWSWGANDYGQISHGAPAGPVKAPFRLGTGTDWKTVAAAGYSNLALKNDSTLWSWGWSGYGGVLGQGRVDDYRQEVVTQVGTDRDWKMIAAGHYTGCALKNDGSLWAWGYNRSGQLGDGTTTDKAVPTRVGERNDWVSVSAAGHVVVAVKSDGSVWTWGVGFGVFPTRLYNPAFITGIGLQGDAETLPATDRWHYFEKDCRLICGVQQTNNWGDGVRATGNSLTARVWVDRRIGYSVKRHYQITPALDAATTTGKVKLYFTQEEFDEFNAVATNLKKLPTGPDDAAGKANLLVEKRSGVSADGSGSPASYPGTPETINPADADIVWDATYRRWEVTFDVTGFSGFWVKTTDQPLPVTFGSIAARLQGGSLWVDFTSEKETNNHHYEIEASTDGKTFKKIGELRSQAPDGNSDTPISYTFKTAVSGIIGAAGIAGVILLALAAGAGSRRRRLLPAAIVAISLCVAACVKHSREPVAHHSPKIWVRIAQVDKDGTKEYSKIVQAVAKD